MQYRQTFLGSATFFQTARKLIEVGWLAMTAEEITQAMGKDFVIDRTNLNILAKEIADTGLVCGVESFVNTQTMEAITYYLLIGDSKRSYMRGRQVTRDQLMAKVDGEAQSGGALQTQFLDVGEGLAPVGFGLAHAEEIEVGSVEDQDRRIGQPMVLRLWIAERYSTAKRGGKLQGSA